MRLIPVVAIALFLVAGFPHHMEAPDGGMGGRHCGPTLQCLTPLACGAMLSPGVHETSLVEGADAIAAPRPPSVAFVFSPDTPPPETAAHAA